MMNKIIIRIICLLFYAIKPRMRRRIFNLLLTKYHKAETVAPDTDLERVTYYRKKDGMLYRLFDIKTLNDSQNVGEMKAKIVYIGYANAE